MSEQRDEALEQYFETMKRLWDNTDFQAYLSELVEQADNVNSVEDVAPSAERTAEQELFFRKGQMNIIRTLQNLSDNIALCEEEYHKSLEPQKDTEESY